MLRKEGRLKDYVTASFPVLCKNGVWGDAASGYKVSKEEALHGVVCFTSEYHSKLNQKLCKKLYGYTIDCDDPSFLLFIVWEAERINKHGLIWQPTFSASFKAFDNRPTMISESPYAIDYWFNPVNALLLRKPTLLRNKEAPSIHMACLKMWGCIGADIHLADDPLTLLMEWVSGQLEKSVRLALSKLAHLRKMRFGIEVEFTGISRDAAARTVAKVLGTEKSYLGGIRHEHIMIDDDLRVWKVVRDASIEPSNSRETTFVKENYKCELVTPVLHYSSDIPLLCSIIEALKKRGAVTNTSCGIHIHVDSNLNAEQTRNLVNIICSKEELLKRAICMFPDRRKYCNNTDRQFVWTINKWYPIEMEDIRKAWYKGNLERMGMHYDRSRYVTLNLHSLWNGKGVEFRCFNSTLVSRLIKTYILLSLAICIQAENQTWASYRPSVSNDRVAMTNWLNQLGLTGREYHRERKVLLRYLSTEKRACEGISDNRISCDRIYA